MIGRPMRFSVSADLHPLGFSIRRLFPAFLALALLAAPAARAQEQPTEEEDLTAGLASLENNLKMGKQLFADLRFPEAIAEFDKVVQAYESGIHGKQQKRRPLWPYQD